MRSDLDNLMAERALDAFVIPSTEGSSAARDYLSGGVYASALVIKKRGAPPVLIVNHMEKDEAAKSGLPVMTLDDFNWMDIIKQYGRNTKEARLALWERYVEHFRLSGRITLYGDTEMQSALHLLDTLRTHFAGRFEIVQDEDPDILELASQTKDTEELTKMREVGKRTGAVMQATRDWLSTHRAKDGQVVTSEGKPLTIGDVKRFVRLKLLEYDLEDTSGMIFAQGRDAGVPHTRGEADDILREGESIVFDLFPRTIDGGYYHDMTRTWSLGFAREDVQRDYQMVMDVFWRALEGITLGQPTNVIAKRVCEWFEAAGHPSRLNTPNTEEGYVHSLGHGLGLRVHESPGISHLSPDKEIFRAGNVVTIEPGLYYPSKGYGVRIEDTVYVDENGQLHNLTDCPYDLVIPLNGQR